MSAFAFFVGSDAVKSVFCEQRPIVSSKDVSYSDPVVRTGFIQIPTLPEKKTTGF